MEECETGYDTELGYDTSVYTIEEQRKLEASSAERIAAYYWSVRLGTPPPLLVPNYRLLSQDVWWITGDKRVIKLQDMILPHKKNLLAYLLRCAKRYKFQYTTSIIFGPQPSGDAANDCFDMMIDQLEEEDSLKWMLRQPFVVRLQKLIKRDAKRARKEIEQKQKEEKNKEVWGDKQWQRDLRGL